MVDGTVYVGADDEGLYAVDASTGRREWASDEPSAPIESSPSVVDDTVYVGTSKYSNDDGTLWAVDADSGEQEWAFEEPEGVLFSSPTVADGTVYVGSNAGQLWAVDAADGAKVWHSQVRPAAVGSPTVVDGVVYVGSAASWSPDPNRLYAFDADSGERVWTFDEPSAQLRSSPTVADETVYVGSTTEARVGGTDTLYAVSTADGSQEWAYTGVDGGIASSPTVADGTVYVGSNGGAVHAVDADSGEQEWRFAGPEGAVESSPTVAGGAVVVGSDDGSLYAIDADSGELRWAFARPERPVFSSPTVVGGVAYVGANDGTLYAVRTDVEGSSRGSRVSLGTLGHHDRMRHRDDRRIETPAIETTSTRTPTPTLTAPSTATAAESSDFQVPAVELGLGAGALVSLLAGAAAWRRRSSGGLSDGDGRSDDSDGVAEVGQRAEGGSGPGPAGAVDGQSESDGEEVRERLDRLSGTLDDAETLVSDGEYETATARLHEVRTELDEVARRVEDHDLAAERQSVKRLRERVDELDDRATTALGLQTRLEEARECVAEADEKLDAGDAEAAVAAFDSAAERLDHLEEDLRGRGFTGLLEEFETVRDRCEAGRREAQQRRPGPPSSVPTTPTVDVSYDALERRELVGKGGNADVHRAETPDGQVVALKEPRVSGTMHTDTVERFLEEAETWASLDGHDHVVTVTDYGPEPVPWIAMEYMDGGHLGDRLDDLGVREAAWVATAVTEAVLHAHRRGVGHFDLKPANILFRSVERSWDVPKVGDWGLAKLLLDHSKSIEGLTPEYAAPEQVDDSVGEVGLATDTYQLGAVFYELFTGEPPFTGETYQVLRAVREDDVTPPSEVDTSLPAALDDVLVQALSKRPEDRHEDLVYLRDDLREIYETL